jgi:hypothetical protein
MRANARKNRTSIARQRISKHTALIIDAVLSVESVQSVYKEEKCPTPSFLSKVEHRKKKKKKEKS